LYTLGIDTLLFVGQSAATANLQHTDVRQSDELRFDYFISLAVCMHINSADLMEVPHVLMMCKVNAKL